MLNKHQQEILHRRHVIVGIIAVILVTLLHLWIFVLGFALGIAMIVAFLWFVDWMAGADMTGDMGREADEDTKRYDDTSDTLWDIFILDHIMDHWKRN